MVRAPALDGSLTDLRRQLEAMLVDAGLYPREASAMVETWRDSWFEEGTRVFYVVPRAVADSLLPLEVRPAPNQIARVFVGRMEVVTPAIEAAVRRALDAGDAGVLSAYGRFLGPITDRLLARTSDSRLRDRIRTAREAAFGSYLKKVATCE